MKTHNYKQLVMLLCATLLISSVGKQSHALIPVVDAGTIAQSIENNINMALELKSVKKVVELAGKMNTVIGEAMSTFNEYVTAYNKYKQQVDKALGVAADVAGTAEGILGTNLSSVVEGVGDVYGDITNVGDKIAGANYALNQSGVVQCALEDKECRDCPEKVANGEDLDCEAICAVASTCNKGLDDYANKALDAAQDAANQAGQFADKEACKKCKKQGGDCTSVCGEEASSGDGALGDS